MTELQQDPGRDPARFESVIERKDPSLPRFVIVPSTEVASWRLEGTTVVDVTVNGARLGRRSLKHWGTGRDCWFIDLTEAQCRSANLKTGAIVDVEMRPADSALPDEIVTLLASDLRASSKWHALTPSRRRQLSEHVREGKQAETRARRARAVFIGAGRT